MLQARGQRAVGLEVLLGGVEIDDQKDATEQLQQLLKLGEYLLKKQVVGLDDEDRTRRRIPKIPRHPVVAKLHPAVEPGRIHQHRTRLGEVTGRHFHVDPTNGFGHVCCRVKLLAAGFDFPNPLVERPVGVSDGLLDRLPLMQCLLLAVVAGDHERRVRGVGDVDHAGVSGQAGHLADVRGAHRVHERRLATFKRPENQHVSLLLGHLVDQRLHLVGAFAQFRQHLFDRQFLVGPFQHLDGFLQRCGHRGHLLAKRFTKALQQGAHRRRGVGRVRRGGIFIHWIARCGFTRSSYRQPGGRHFTGAAAAPDHPNLRRPAPGRRAAPAIYPSLRARASPASDSIRYWRRPAACPARVRRTSDA